MTSLTRSEAVASLLDLAEMAERCATRKDEMMSPPKFGTVFPEYCPDFSEDEICPACGADPRPGVPGNYCLARKNGPEPRPLLEVILINRRTGEPV